MTDDRRALAEIIFAHFDWVNPGIGAEKAADAIMAAGWMNVGALQDDLDELEATDPEVKAAADRYDAMVREIAPPARPTEHARLAAIVDAMLPSLKDSLPGRWASDVADAICLSGQWVPRSWLTAMGSRLAAVLAVHQRNMLDSSWCECGVLYDQCPTVRAVTDVGIAQPPAEPAPRRRARRSRRGGARRTPP